MQPEEESLREAILDVWKRVLQIAHVGFDDNFFDLGGHSLRLGKVKDELKSRLGRDVPMVQLFAHPTVGQAADNEIERVIARTLSAGLLTQVFKTKLVIYTQDHIDFPLFLDSMTNSKSTSK